VASLTRLSFEDRYYPARDAETLGDSCCRDRIGGGDDGAQYEGCRPGKTCSPTGHRSHDTGRRQHEADGEQSYWPQVGPEITPGGEDRRDVEQRGQEEQKHHFRLELDPREARRETQDQPAQDQQDRVWNPYPDGERR
jgi:hypothetical protein